MAGETGGGGGDREGSSPPGPINSISWVGPGEQIYNENGPFLLLLGCFSAIAIVVYVVLGPLRHLGTPCQVGLRPERTIFRSGGQDAHEVLVSFWVGTAFSNTLY